MAETALSLVDGVLKDGGIVMCETDYREDLPEEVGDIKKLRNINIPRLNSLPIKSNSEGFS